MKILSFSAVEVLPALFSKAKVQTIRPAWYKIEKLPLMNGGKIDKIIPFPIPKLPEQIEKEVVKNFKKRIEKTQNKINSIIASGGLKPARFKVGEQIKICWKSRGTPKDAKFCNVDGHLLDFKLIRKGGRHVHSIEYFNTNLEFCRPFSKLLGTATITDVFQIEMGKDDEGRLSLRNSKYGSEALALVDGFKNREEMFAYFDSHYDLSSPKKFWCYRWRWE